MLGKELQVLQSEMVRLGALLSDAEQAYQKCDGDAAVNQLEKTAELEVRPLVRIFFFYTSRASIRWPPCPWSLNSNIAKYVVCFVTALQKTRASLKGHQQEVDALHQSLFTAQQRLQQARQQGADLKDRVRLQSQENKANAAQRTNDEAVARVATLKQQQKEAEEIKSNKLLVARLNKSLACWEMSYHRVRGF